jgi:hypothetical protein
MFNGSDNLRIGGGLNGSYMHPVVMVLLLIAIALIFALPRKYVILPILLTVFLTPFGQQIYVAGAHVFLFRVLILCGWLRIAWKKKSSLRVELGSFGAIDKIFVLWALFRAIATFLEFAQFQAVVSECGFLVDSIGGFFLLRALIREQEDIVRVLKTLALVVSVLAATMTYERVHNQNLFGYIGGQLVPQLRDGAIRSQGSFQGPITAGTFAATFLCLFFWLWRSGKSPKLGIAGIVGSIVMVITSASSTPLMGLAAGLLAVLMWPMRKQMRLIRWGIAVVLIVLHIVMKAPVWMLINHVNLVGGSSSYHRAMLVDQFIRHFSDWWLIGVQSTANWGWDMWDQANQFVWEGESGGLATFICFVLLVSCSFGRLGTARKRIQGERSMEWLFWLLGCTLFAFVVAFFGISLSDQLVWGWYGLLAMICAATSSAFVRKTDPSACQANLVIEPQPTRLDNPVSLDSHRGLLTKI